MNADRVDRESETALKKIAALEGIDKNRKEVEKVVDGEVIRSLIDGGLIEYPVLLDDHGYGEYKRIERTLKGRNYFKERQRDKVEQYGPQIAGGLVAILGTLLGTVFGAWLSTSHPFG